MKKFVSYAMYRTPANGCFYGYYTSQSLTNTNEINIELLTVSASAVEFLKFLPNLSFIICHFIDDYFGDIVVAIKCCI